MTTVASCLPSHCGCLSIITLQGLSRCHFPRFAFRLRVLMRSVEVTVAVRSTSIQTSSLNPQWTTGSRKNAAVPLTFISLCYTDAEKTEMFCPVLYNIQKQFTSCRRVNQSQPEMNCDWPAGSGLQQLSVCTLNPYILWDLLMH